MSNSLKDQYASTPLFGGNAGAVAAGFLFKGAMEWNDVFFTIGVVVAIASLLTFFIKFSPEQEAEEKALFEKANMDLLQIRADRANNALIHSAQVVADYNAAHDEKV